MKKPPMSAGKCRCTTVRHRFMEGDRVIDLNGRHGRVTQVIVGVAYDFRADDEEEDTLSYQEDELRPERKNCAGKPSHEHQR